MAKKPTFNETEQDAVTHIQVWQNKQYGDCFLIEVQADGDIIAVSSPFTPTEVDGIDLSSMRGFDNDAGRVEWVRSNLDAFAIIRRDDDI